MYISNSALKQIIEKYKTHLINKRIIDISLVNSRLFLCTIKNEKYKLIIDLDNLNPHVGMIKLDYSELTLPSDFINKAMNKGSPLIKNIEVINSDNIIRITTTSTDAYYHNNIYYLYLELIKSRANIILTNSENIIIAAFHETNLLAPRLIMKNIKYVLPNNKINETCANKISFADYQKYVITSFNNGIIKRRKEIYGPLMNKIKKKIKSLENKIKKINESVLEASKADIYKEYGETLLMNIGNIKKGETLFNNIPIDPSKTISENANLYFNKYKKKKRTKEISADILKNANEELDENKYYLDVFKLGKEEDINHFLIKSKKKNKKESIKAYLPYYVSYQNIHYYYGKNNLQNDYLTFKMFRNSSDVIWMHIKDKPSAHLIIATDKITNEILDLAASILLIINDMKIGEIIYAKRKNISRGEDLGKVKVNAYKSINMRKINIKANGILDKEKRVNEQ